VRSRLPIRTGGGPRCILKPDDPSSSLSVLRTYAEIAATNSRRQPTSSAESRNDADASRIAQEMVDFLTHWLKTLSGHRAARQLEEGVRSLIGGSRNRAAGRSQIFWPKVRYNFRSTFSSKTDSRNGCSERPAYKNFLPKHPHRRRSVVLPGGPEHRPLS
jgi:hypothetical protein